MIFCEPNTLLLEPLIDELSPLIKFSLPLTFKLSPIILLLLPETTLLLVSILLAGRTCAFRACIAIVSAYLVEVSQLYHAPWIDTIRQTTLGGLVLGHGFLWSDFACYSVGVTAGVVAERAIEWLRNAASGPKSGEPRASES